MKENKPFYKMGSVALIGRPNVGKSTLLNHLLNYKLSIISPKPQTSRHTIRGILTAKDYQIVFLDTPGLMSRPRDSLDRRMRSLAYEAMEEADLILLLVEPFLPGVVEKECIQSLIEIKKPSILAINKIDQIKKDILLPVIEQYNKRFPFIHIVPVSAKSSQGMDLLTELIVLSLPLGEREYPEDELTNRSERFLTGELIRQQLYYLYGEEIPYDTAVSIEGFKDGLSESGDKTVIKATIIVEKISQRRILIGSQGAALKKVGINARKEIERFLQRPVFLDLWVQVQPNWRKDQQLLEELDY